MLMLSAVHKVPSENTTNIKAERSTTQSNLKKNTETQFFGFRSSTDLFLMSAWMSSKSRQLNDFYDQMINCTYSVLTL